jgi:hypothetical protein
MGRGEGSNSDDILFGDQGFRRPAKSEAEIEADRWGGTTPRTATVRKDYAYRGFGSGTDEFSLTELAESHIQDWGAAMADAERLLRWGKTENNDDHEGVWETYTLCDREGFIKQLKMLFEEEPDYADWADLDEFLGG